MTGFATKEELTQIKNAMHAGFSDARVELNRVKGELELKMAGVKCELEVKMADVKGDLEVKIANVKSDVLRWMFAFFVTTLLAILGLYFKK